MLESEKNEIIRTKIEPRIDIIKEELAADIDFETLEDGEELHRELSVLSVEDLLRPFTI